MKKIILLLSFILFSVAAYAQEGDTIATGSGLKYIILYEGEGLPAQNGMAVDVHYTGYLTDGRKFDSSRDRGEPFSFVLGEGQVIKGWEEGIALMSAGGSYRLIIPPDLAYGQRGAGDVIPPNATLIFDVELLSVYAPKKSVVVPMLETIFDKSVADAIALYNDLKATAPDEYNFKESQLNMLGYQLLEGERISDAIEIFKLNVEAYPASANVYDSLGEAYLMNGDHELAKANYEKSLELDPNNENAKKMLDRINQ